MSSTRVVGVDPGTRSSGVACIEYCDLTRGLRDIKVVDMLTLELNSTTCMIDRISALHGMFFKLFQQYQASVCLLEKCSA